VKADQHMCCSVDVGGRRAVVHHTDTDAYHHKIATKCTDICSVSLRPLSLQVSTILVVLILLSKSYVDRFLLLRLSVLCDHD